MNDPVIRWEHTPKYEPGRPVFPKDPSRPSPFLLSRMRGWHWQVEIEVYTLQYFLSGNGYYEAGKRRFEIGPGHCFLFRPGEKVLGRADDDQPFTIFAAHFEEVSQAARADHPLHCQIHEISLMEALVEYAVKCRLDDAPRSRWEARSAVHTIYHLFLGNLARPAKPTLQIQIEALVESIRRNPGEDWTVDRMSADIGLSRSHLTRWFTAITGMSPTRYVIRQRVARAVELITLTRRGIEDIALELGYRDPRFFSRQFSRVMGHPPAYFRGRGRPGMLQ